MLVSLTAFSTLAGIYDLTENTLAHEQFSTKKSENEEQAA